MWSRFFYLNNTQPSYGKCIRFLTAFDFKGILELCYSISNFYIGAVAKALDAHIIIAHVVRYVTDFFFKKKTLFVELCSQGPLTDINQIAL